jgi:uncharacterized integral membrane protein
MVPGILTLSLDGGKWSTLGLYRFALKEAPGTNSIRNSVDLKAGIDAAEISPTVVQSATRRYTGLSLSLSLSLSRTLHIDYCKALRCILMPCYVKEL